MVCPNVTGRTKEKIAQSKRARAGSLTLVDYPQVARTCILRACIWFADVMTSFSSVTFVLFLLRFRLHAFFVEAATLRSIVLRYAGAPIATRVFFFFFLDVAFSEYVLYHFRFLFVWRVRRTFFSFRMVFFHLVTTGWIFDISLPGYVRVQSINQSKCTLVQNGGGAFVNF